LNERTVHAFPAFIGVAVVVTLTPGPATALVIRNTLRGGRRAALLTTLGNSIGVLFWGCASAVGISALIAASEVAFDVLKVTGAVVLIVLGVQSWRRRGEPSVQRSTRWPFRDGVLTSLANPKLAIFFLALFPQFLSGRATLSQGLAMASLIVALDLVWYSTLALLISRGGRAFVASRWPRRLERLTGGVLVGLALRLAVESR
jgi:threonine/homoserine/homoserine lactone efflux protein